MKYLILGGTGLISTSITRMLLEQGEDVTLFNRGISPARFPPGAKLIQGDRKNMSASESQITDAGRFDVVIDMICFLPGEAQSAISLFKGKTGHYIFCSTVDVYSKPATRFPYTENEPRQAITDYGRNKVICEDLFLDASTKGYFPVTVIRPAATYGEGGMIIHTFGWNTTYLDRIRKGKPVIVSGDGNSLWVMCHIDDCARAFINASMNPVAYGKAYHVTGEEWFTWNQYHQIVAQAINAPPPTLVHIPADLLWRLAPKQSAITMFNFQFSNIYDNSAAIRDLGFEYRIPWLVGARRTYDWLDQNNRINDSDQDPLDDRLIAAWLDASQQLSDNFSHIQ